MSLNSSMDKVLERRREVEERLSASANMTNNDLAQLSRELSDLRPICDQIELVRRIETELADALLMVDEAGDDADMLQMVQAEAGLLKAQLPEAQSASRFRQLGFQQIGFSLNHFMHISIVTNLINHQQRICKFQFKPPD